MGEIFQVLWSLGGLALAVFCAYVAAILAEDRGQPGALWFIIGFFLPVLALLVLLVFFDREPSSPRYQPNPQEAVLAGPVARALIASPHASVHALTERTGLSEREVLRQLRALQHLGRVTRDDTGRFDLTPAA